MDEPFQQSATIVHRSSRRKFIAGLLGGISVALCIPSIDKLIIYWQEAGLVRKFPWNYYSGRMLFFSPDLTNVATISGQTKEWLIWNYPSQRVIQQFALDPDSTNHAWSPDQRYLLYYRNPFYNGNSPKDTTSSIDLLDLSTRKKVLIIKGDYDTIAFDQAYWSPDSTHIALISNGKLTLRDATTDQVIAQPFQLKDNQGALYLATCAWSPDGKRLALVGYRQSQTDNSIYTTQVHIWDVGTQSIVAKALNPTQITNLAGESKLLSWSPDGTHIVASLGQQLWLLNPNDAKKSAHIGDQYSPVNGPALAWSPESKFFAFSSRLESQFESELAIWRVADLQKVQIIDRGSTPQDIAQMYWPPSGERLMIISDFGTQESLFLSN